MKYSDFVSVEVLDYFELSQWMWELQIVAETQIVHKGHDVKYRTL